MKEGTQNTNTNTNVKFNSAAYFSTPVWVAEAPVFLKKMLKLIRNNVNKKELFFATTQLK